MSVQELLQDLPRLEEEEALSLEHPLSYSELTQVVQQQNSGRSPGIDGLSGEFYKAFWSLLGPDLHTVLQESVEQGNLPLSCRRAVLSLLPKKGDLAPCLPPMRGRKDFLQSTHQQVKGCSRLSGP